MRRGQILLDAKAASAFFAIEIADVHKFFEGFLKFVKMGKKFSLLLSYFFKFKIVVVDKDCPLLWISLFFCFKSITYRSSTLVCDCAFDLYPKKG